MHKLFMVLIGCAPKGRHTEQHDVFFGIGQSIRDILPALPAFWPEAQNSLHLDAWREVNLVNGYRVRVVEKQSQADPGVQLFFLNLGGYKQNEFEEFHYKMIVAAPGKGEAVKQAKETAFFRHTGFKGATSHIDDKYGVDVDDFHAIEDILTLADKQRFSLIVEPAPVDQQPDQIHLGYFKPGKVDAWAPPDSII
jgi:hypothetical protein